VLGAKRVAGVFVRKHQRRRPGMLERLLGVQPWVVRYFHLDRMFLTVVNQRNGLVVAFNIGGARLLGAGMASIFVYAAESSDVSSRCSSLTVCYRRSRL
jgi:hypothetical protein